MAQHWWRPTRPVQSASRHGNSIWSTVSCLSRRSTQPRNEPLVYLSSHEIKRITLVLSIWPRLSKSFWHLACCLDWRARYCTYATQVYRSAMFSRLSRYCTKAVGSLSRRPPTIQALLSTIGCILFQSSSSKTQTKANATSTIKERHTIMIQLYQEGWIRLCHTIQVLFNIDLNKQGLEKREKVWRWSKRTISTAVPISIYMRAALCKSHFDQNCLCISDTCRLFMNMILVWVGSRN